MPKGKHMKKNKESIRINDHYQLKARVEIVLLVINITLMITLVYSEEIFGSDLGANIKPFAFGGLMLILGIYIAKGTSIWEKKNRPSQPIKQSQ